MKKLFGILIALVAFAAVAEDRMPAIPLDKMTPDQRGPAEEIIKGPRGALYGPFVPLIRSPELMDRSSKMGEYLRYRSAIGNRLSAEEPCPICAGSPASCVRVTVPTE